MTTTANATLYSEEIISEFERGKTLLPMTVTTEVLKRGTQYYFVSAGSGGTSAVTRGVDGMIPRTTIDNTQTAVTLTEWHALETVTDFNVFGHQAGGQLLGTGERFALYRAATRKMNRKIDDNIVTAMNTATLGPSNTPTTDAFGLVTSAISQMGRADVPTDDGNLYLGVSHGFLSSLQSNPEFSNAEYVTMKPFDTGVGKTMNFIKWNGVNIFLHNALPGAGTSSETNFLYHKNAIGYVSDSESMKVFAGFNEEQGYSYVRASCSHGAALLDNTAISKLLFDNSGSTPATIS